MNYTIDEEVARRAKEANSFYDYIPGSATAEYERLVEKAEEIAAKQKEIVDPMYHEKIDALLEKYRRKLAENINESNAIEARVPSVLIAGPANFPVRAKEKQNAARHRNSQQYAEVAGILERIKGVGTAGISADDTNAIAKLEAKLEHMESEQEYMKRANAYYRKNATMRGFEDMSNYDAALLDNKIKAGYSWEQRPFPAYCLTNNSANMRRVRERIAELKTRDTGVFKGWKFAGGEVVINNEVNRLQIVFDEKPEEELRGELKRNGFRWAPSQSAWQRQLNRNAMSAAQSIQTIAEGVCT